MVTAVAPKYTMVEHSPEVAAMLSDLVADARAAAGEEDRKPGRASVIRALIRAAHSARKNTARNSRKTY